MRPIRLFILILALVLALPCASASQAETCACIIVSLESQDSVLIRDPAILERLMNDVLSPVDFSGVQWLSEGDGSFSPGDGFAYTVRILRNPETPNQEEVTIAVGETSILLGDEAVETDAVTLYLLDGLFDGLLAATVPGAKPLG